MRALGAILEPLGGVLAPLGAVLGPLGAVSWGYVGATCLLIDFGIDLGAILVSKRLPKRVQNGVKNGPKSNTKFNIKYVGFQEPLGSVLGLSWVVWGSILGSKIVKFQWFYKGFVKITFLKKIRLGRPSWTELGSIWVPQKGSKWVPKRSPNRSKTDQQIIKK